MSQRISRPILSAVTRERPSGENATAITTAADYLVTRNNDMLDLMQDAAFRARYPTLTILDPVALLQILNPPTQRP